MSIHFDKWRLIIGVAFNGALNMAIDEAILDSVGSGDSPPTLRLYRWEPVCLSLGYAQPATDVDQERLATHSWHLVRRMTGGRAILHTDELTYSVALPMDHPLVVGSIPDSYRRISAALLTALQTLGLDANADKRHHKTAAPVGAVCFEVPSDYEITAYGKKLIGSAQVRRYNAALQHGSLPLYGDVSRICDVLAFDSEEERHTARDRVRQRATTLSDALGRRIEWDNAAQAVIAAFTDCFNITFEESSLSASEAIQAQELQARYTDPAWTLKR